ncbi:GAF domain-containing sensor histidine kinase [Nocardioides sp. URHA0032]|uniref:GAF domain-containing sensor histidine kinase n=1 Tax=Nocardioides sp. URHA0032 TaxID=1380388 RepID=UPI0006877FC0|nr:histidine kinase [Nocardioides sp. URHA0032]
MTATDGAVPRARRVSARTLWDRSVHRVLYTLLFMFVAVIMATLVVPPLRLYSGVHEQIIALAVILVVAIELLSTRLHRFVDWLLYGQRSDPAAATARLARPIANSDDAHTLEELLAALAETLRLSYVGVRINQPASITEAGVDAGSATLAVPIRRAGRELGALRAGRRGQPLDRRDERLLEAAAAQIGLVLHARSLTEELRTAREELISGVEEERRRLRRDIHDGVGPTLAGIALGAESADRAVDQNPARAHQLLSCLRTDVAGLVAEVRRVVDGLRPALLDELGLVGSLQQLGRSIEERTGVAVTVDASDQVSLPAAVEVAAYRIAAEALTNLARHATPQRAWVRVQAVDQNLLLEISDDGCGGAGDRPGGIGMGSMRQRAEDVGGTLEVTSGVAGTVVRARLPLQTAVSA